MKQEKRILYDEPYTKAEYFKLMAAQDSNIADYLPDWYQLRPCKDVTGGVDHRRLILSTQDLHKLVDIVLP